MTKELALIMLMALGYGLLFCGSISFGSVMVQGLQNKPVSRARWIVSAAMTIAGLLLAWLSMSRA